MEWKSESGRSAHCNIAGKEKQMNSHAETFDEIIARGFPLKQLEELAKAQGDRVRARQPSVALGLAAATALPASALPATARKDQAILTAADRTAFQNAIVQLVAEGKYLQLVQDHMDMSHNMHGSMGEVGLYRFLAWHRRYLVEFERQLQRVDANLRPGVADKLGVPYWRWQDAFPAWMAGFLPAEGTRTRGRRRQRGRMRRPHPKLTPPT